MLESGTLMLLSIGFLPGVKYASEAAHVAAVSTIASIRGSIFESSMVGISWAALMMLVLATAGSIYQVPLYLLFFGAGSIPGMLLITTLIGFSLSRATAHFGAASGSRAAVRLLSIGIGAAIHLFNAHLSSAPTKQKRKVYI